MRRAWAVGILIAGLALVGLVYGCIWYAIPNQPAARDWPWAIPLLLGPYLLAALECMRSTSRLDRALAILIVAMGVLIAGGTFVDAWPTFSGGAPPDPPGSALLSAVLLLGQYELGLAVTVAGLITRRVPKAELPPPMGAAETWRLLWLWLWIPLSAGTFVLLGFVPLDKSGNFWTAWASVLFGDTHVAGDDQGEYGDDQGEYYVAPIATGHVAFALAVIGYFYFFIALAVGWALEVFVLVVRWWRREGQESELARRSKPATDYSTLPKFPGDEPPNLATPDPTT